MISGVGIDIIEIERIKKAISKNKTFLKKIFTEREIGYFDSRNNRTEVIAGNFAVKEAVVKALGVGFVGIGFKDVEALRDTFGKPYIVLHNKARTMLGSNCTIHVSISHCRDYAVANATIESLTIDKIDEISFSMFQKLQ